MVGKNKNPDGVAQKVRVRKPKTEKKKVKAVKKWKFADRLAIKSVGLKIYSLVAIIVVVALALILLMSSVLVRLKNINEEIINNEVKEIEEISEISRDFSYVNGLILTHILESNTSKMSDLEGTINERLDLLDEKVADFDKKIAKDDPRREAYDKFLDDYQRYGKTCEIMLKTSTLNKQQASVSATSNFSIFAENVETYIDEILTISNNNLKEAKTESSDYAAMIPIVVGLACIMLAGVTAVIVFVTRNAIVKPIRMTTNQLKEIMKSIALEQGDLSVRININSQDEIGKLASGINSFLEMLQEIIDNISRSCEVLSTQYASVIYNVEKAKSGADDTSAALEEMSAGMEEVAARVTMVSEETRDIGTSVDDMTKKAEEGTDYAENIKEKAEALDAQAKASKSEVNQIVTAIDTAVSQSVEKGRGISKISELTGEILGIANQTNLLALNASIEAARAGEAGRGFAVVADEIRKLAENSKNTASHIQDISDEVIESVEELSENATKLLEFVNTRVLSDYDALEETGKQYYEAADTMNKIMYQFSFATEKLMAVMQKVNDANEGIADTVQESTEAITNVSGNTNELAEEMKEVLGATSGVNEVIEQLMKEVNSFIK